MKMKQIEIWRHKQNGIRTIIPEENCLRLQLGFGLGLELILGLGGQFSSGTIVLEPTKTYHLVTLKQCAASWKS